MVFHVASFLYLEILLEFVTNSILNKHLVILIMCSKIKGRKWYLLLCICESDQNKPKIKLQRKRFETKTNLIVSIISIIKLVVSFK